jgi:hypothetical protein
MPQQRSHPRQQLAQRKRLADIIVRAKIQTHHAITFLRPRRQHQDGPAESLSAHPPAQIVSVQFRQQQVEDQQVGRVLPQQPVARFAIGSRHHLVRLELQVIPQTAQDGRIVFNNENSAHKIYRAQLNLNFVVVCEEFVPLVILSPALWLRSAALWTRTLACALTKASS